MSIFIPTPKIPPSLFTLNAFRSSVPWPREKMRQRPRPRNLNKFISQGAYPIEERVLRPWALIGARGIPRRMDAPDPLAGGNRHAVSPSESDNKNLGNLETEAKIARTLKS